MKAFVTTAILLATLALFPGSVLAKGRKITSHECLHIAPHRVNPHVLHECLHPPRGVSGIHGLLRRESAPR